MKIAVAYNDGLINEHFGHCEQFKMYEINETSEIVSEEIVAANASGHDGITAFLKEQGVEVVICGGMGAGAEKALLEAGIIPFAGASGEVDKVVDSFLNDSLVNSGVNCDHHSHEDGEGCGCGDDCGCSGGCGGCGGGCGGGLQYEPSFDGPNVGMACRVHYRGTLDDGTQFDASYDRGEPLEFLCGAGMMIVGFDKAVANMAVGEKVNVHLECEEAYGEPVPEAIVTFDVTGMPGADELEIGSQVALQNMFGQPVPAKVVKIDGSNVTFDANHELAGKALNFEIELLEVKEV